MSKSPTYSPELTSKIAAFKSKIPAKQLGPIRCDSPLILAPMAGICNAPFRLLMQELGAGMTVSELISCHGINHGNQLTRDMLKVLPDEKTIGIQLFGEDAEAMAKAAVSVLEISRADFIDINMGCPVKKVVTKGGGSALLKDVKELPRFFSTIKKALGEVPLTIKIRTGWDSDDRNASEIINIAHGEGVSFVAIHGRTRAQQYTGRADWDFIEETKKKAPLPLIGNGDLHSPWSTRKQLERTHCDALMIARGCLRNPFIFLESFADSEDALKKSHFFGKDYFEVVKRLQYYTEQCFNNPRTQLIQIRKLIVWFAAGFPEAAKFRGRIFETQTMDECMDITQEYFLGLENSQKSINYDEIFMSSGHG